YSSKLQYSLRSIIAISVEFKGRRDKRFEQAYKTLNQALQELSKEKHVRNGAVDDIIKYLKEGSVKRTLSHYFGSLIEFADLTAQLLVDPQLRTRLFTESEDIFLRDEWQYNLTPGVYSGDIIESPINFLVSCLRMAINDQKTSGTRSGERESTWMYHII